MADIQLRFHKDMLVLSSPIECELNRLGVTSEADRAYALLFEPEVLEELYKIEAITGVQCVVADTALLTPAHLARLGMTKDAKALATNAIELAMSVKPQHVLVEVGPCGLPIDTSSKSSLIENRDQYTKVAKLFEQDDFDAFFLNEFSRVADLKCALMGVRKVSDKPIIASVLLDRQGYLVRARGCAVRSATPNAFQETLEDAVCAMNDLGADVVGFSTDAPADEAVRLLDRVRAVCDLPTLVQLEVRSRDAEQAAATSENPYFEPDTMVDAADVLRDAGVQFLRAIGDVTPAYTGALVAATDKMDVVCDDAAARVSFDTNTDLDDLAERLRERISVAMGTANEQ